MRPAFRSLLQHANSTGSARFLPACWATQVQEAATNYRVLGNSPARPPRAAPPTSMIIAWNTHKTIAVIEIFFGFRDAHKMHIFRHLVPVPNSPDTTVPGDVFCHTKCYLLVGCLCRECGGQVTRRIGPGGAVLGHAGPRRHYSYRMVAGKGGIFIWVWLGFTLFGLDGMLCGSGLAGERRSFAVRQVYGFEDQESHQAPVTSAGTRTLQNYLGQAPDLHASREARPPTLSADGVTVKQVVNALWEVPQTSYPPERARRRRPP